MKPVRSLLAGGKVIVMRPKPKPPRVQETAAPERLDIENLLGVQDALDRMRLAIIASTPAFNAPVVEKPEVPGRSDEAGIAARDAQIETLRGLLGEAEDRASQANADSAANRTAAAELHKSIDRMHIAHDEAMRTNQRIVNVPGPPVPPPRSADITIKPTFGMTGLLQRVVLSAKGYDTVTLDVDRAPDGTIRQLKERTP